MLIVLISSPFERTSNHSFDIKYSFNRFFKCGIEPNFFKPKIESNNNKALGQVWFCVHYTFLILVCCKILFLYLCIGTKFHNKLKTWDYIVTKILQEIKIRDCI
jgi:hypothetical protein